MIPLVDAHCHIDLCIEKNGQTASEFLQGLNPRPELIVQVSCHPESLKATRDLLDFPGVYGSFGIHPHEANLYNSKVELELIECLQHPKAVALGEIGLDYHYDFSPRDVQKQVFQRQLKLALDLGRPVVLHTREAEADTLEMLQAMPLSGCSLYVHCYTGSVEFAKKLLQLDAEVYFGFTGILTFKTAEEIRKVALMVPEDRILTETDSPFLAPVPFRGKDANPGMVSFVLEALAKARGTEVERLGMVCRENARRFYGV